MVKRKNKNKNIILFAVSTVGIVMLLLIIVYLNGKQFIVGNNPQNSQALSQQNVQKALSTTQSTRTETNNKISETTRSSETEKKSTSTINSSRLQSNTNATRLDEIGNSNLEFDTLDEAYDYGAAVLNNPQQLNELRQKGYRGYIVRSIRWTNGAITYTIDWQ